MNAAERRGLCVEELEQFLRIVTAPNTDMTVVAINPVTEQCEGKAYTAESIGEAVAWLAAREDWNLYWSVNPLKKPLDKKPAKADVKIMRYVHLDCDDASDEALARIRNYFSPPTIITFSGGGYQAFWALLEPPLVGSNSALLEAANRRVLQDLDHGHLGTHNLDRIMRLPGTTNYPNATKRAKGRIPAATRLVECHPERLYALEDFAPPRPVSAPKKDTSQSAQLLRSVARVMNEEVPEDDDAIVEHFRTHPHAARQSDPERAVRRCIDKVRRDRGAVLEEMNARHCVVSWKGKTVVLTEKWDYTFERNSFDLSSFGDFKNWYSNQFIGKRTRGQWWLSQAERRQYESVVFAPQRTVPNAYNLWRGFGCEPRPGDCALFLRMIEEVVCAGDRALAQYVIWWMADALQHPTDRPGVVLVLRGKQGIGKGTFAREFGALFGTHFLHVFNAQHLVGRFNAHLANALMLFADECFWAGDKQHEGVLKGLITEPTIAIEYKGKDVVHVPNYVRVIMASNKDWVVPAALDDRRFCVIDVSEKHMQDVAYFGAIKQQMKNGGAEALLDYLLKVDLRDVNLRKIPNTAARREQQLRSMEPMVAFWFERLNNGSQLQTEDHWLTEVVKGELFREYTGGAQRAGEYRRGGETQLGILLRKMCPGVRDSRLERMHNAQKRRMAVYLFPTLEQCRREFEQYAGQSFDWNVATGAVRVPSDTADYVVPL